MLPGSWLVPLLPAARHVSASSLWAVFAPERIGAPALSAPSPWPGSRGFCSQASGTDERQRLIARNRYRHLSPVNFLVVSSSTQSRPYRDDVLRTRP
jgi:hypothetical protein